MEDEIAVLKENLEFIKAYAEGKTIQVNRLGKWIDLENVNLLFDVSWRYCFRIKPEPKKVPMTYEDFDGVNINWVRNIEYPDTHYRIDFISKEMIISNSMGCRLYWGSTMMIKSYEWSTDRVNWHKFEKEIEE